MQVQARQGDTLDQLCWRYLGASSGIVEAALQLNPGLADLGPQLPHGQVVTLPDAATTLSNNTRIVQLWD